MFTKFVALAMLWVSLFLAGIIPFEVVVYLSGATVDKHLANARASYGHTVPPSLQHGRRLRGVVSQPMLYPNPSSSASASMNAPDATRIWTQITFSVAYDETLMSHTIQHYLNLGLLPEYFLIGLHADQHKEHNERNSDSPTARIAERLQLEYGIRHVHEWYGNFTSQENWNQKLQHRQEVKVQDCDWIIKVDADELVRNIPYGNFPRFLETLQAKHHDVVYGTMVDRVSSTGDLFEISNTSLIQDQFPLECHITQAAQANTTKVVAFRGYLTEFRAGHGLVYGQESCPYPRRLVLDHYKWHSSVVTKLQERLTHYQWLEGQGHGFHWWRESDTILKHLTDHEHNRGGSKSYYRVNIHNPQFSCQEATSETMRMSADNYDSSRAIGLSHTSSCPRQSACASDRR